MGLVYKAEDMEKLPLCGPEVLPDELAKDALALERFRKEARAASAWKHPDIYTRYEIGNADGRSHLGL